MMKHFLIPTKEIQINSLPQTAYIISKQTFPCSLISLPENTDITFYRIIQFFTRRKMECSFFQFPTMHFLSVYNGILTFIFPQFWLFHFFSTSKSVCAIRSGFSTLPVCLGNRPAFFASNTSQGTLSAIRTQRLSGFRCSPMGWLKSKRGAVFYLLVCTFWLLKGSLDTKLSFVRTCIFIFFIYHKHTVIFCHYTPIFCIFSDIFNSVSQKKIIEIM